MKKIAFTLSPHPQACRLTRHIGYWRNITSPLLREVCFQLEQYAKKQREVLKLHNWCKCLRKSHPERMRKDPANINKLACFFPLANDTQSFARQSARNDNNVRSTVKTLLTYLPTNLLTSKKAAFTLAEVLITLGIIGVVAAVTMPTLIQNHTKSVIESRLKKFYSSINQAIILYEQETGDMRKDWSVINECTDGEDSYSCNLLFFDKYLKKYMNYTKIENKDNLLYVYFADGSAVRFLYYGKDMYFYPKASIIGKSNIKSGKDIFLFALYPGCANQERCIGFTNKGVEPYIQIGWDGTYESLYQYGACGAKIIQLNGWKIPDDYPFLK